MLVRVLSKLKNEQEAKNNSAPYSWQAISSIMQNTTGQALDYKTFKAEVDSNPQMKELFHSFDDQGIYFVKPPKIGQNADAEQSRAAITSSAKRAAANVLKK